LRWPKDKNGITKKKVKIKIINADTRAAGWISYSLYNMVDKKEIFLEIEKVKKSEKSIELWIGVTIGYIVGKSLDVAYFRIQDKIMRLLKKWKRRREHTPLEIFFDNERIE